MAIQQSFPVAQATVVGMLSHPEGGPDTRQVIPPSEVVAIS